LSSYLELKLPAFKYYCKKQMTIEYFFAKFFCSKVIPYVNKATLFPYKCKQHRCLRNFKNESLLLEHEKVVHPIDSTKKPKLDQEDKDANEFLEEFEDLLNKKNFSYDTITCLYVNINSLNKKYKYLIKAISSWQTQLDCLDFTETKVLTQNGQPQIPGYKYFAYFGKKAPNQKLSFRGTASYVREIDNEGILNLNICF